MPHRVHQLIPVFTPGDAMGQAAVSWQRILRHVGFTGRIYAEEVAPKWRSLVQPISHLRAEPDDLVLYHHGIASGLVSKVLHLRARKGIVFHNITPERYYPGTALAGSLRAGRAQLAALAEAVDISLGVSEFNAAELREAGHRNVHVVPLCVEPQRFTSASADLAWLKRFRALPGPVVLSVSRVVAHKRIEDLLALHRELRRISPEAKLLIVGGYDAGHAYFKSLRHEAQQIGNVEFLGRVNHEQLVAAYRGAQVLVSMSEHEGVGVPLLEAMAAELPVLAFGAAAVPETMGGRGIVFHEKRFAELAELVNLMHRDRELRASVIAGQLERVRDFSTERVAEGLRLALVPPGARKIPKRQAKPRVAIVVQRYGADLTGGAESHARQVATRLVEHVEVEVLTTCATDHLTWKNTLPAGVERDGKITVHRFPTVRARSMRPFNALSREIFGKGTDALTEQHWLAEQGPLAPELLEALAARRNTWDAVIFFTYLYSPTVHGVPLVASKALVVPTAHDEPPLAFTAFEDVFVPPQALLCNTEEERALILRRFRTPARSRVVGVGVEPPRDRSPERFRKAHGISGPYVVYLGRLEAGKGVDELVRFHGRSPHTLVLAGAGDLALKGRNVRSVGRLSEQHKWDALAGAHAVIVPSRYESLSLVALEAFSVGTPVLANAGSPVLVGHIARSSAGATYTSAQSYTEGLRTIGAQREKMSSAARKYAARFTWRRVISTYLNEIERLRKTP